MNAPATNSALDRAIRAGQLLDLYGPLLTERQREFIRLHYAEDLSFGEIAESFEISRQAVHDAVKHAEAALEDYEAKLGLLARLGAPAPRHQAPNTDCIGRLEAIHREFRNQGGVIYNAEPLIGRLGDIIRDLKGEHPREDQA